MPAPPLLSEPAMVSATGKVIVSCHRQLWAITLTRRVVASKFRRAILGLKTASGDISDDPLFHADQVQAWPVLHGRQCACGEGDRLRDLLDGRPLRSLGEVLCR